MNKKTKDCDEMQNENSIGSGNRGMHKRSAGSHCDLLSQTVNSHKVAQHGEVQEGR